MFTRIASWWPTTDTLRPLRAPFVWLRSAIAMVERHRRLGWACAIGWRLALGLCLVVLGVLLLGWVSIVLIPLGAWHLYIAALRADDLRLHRSLSFGERKRQKRENARLLSDYYADTRTGGTEKLVGYLGEDHRTTIRRDAAFRIGRKRALEAVPLLVPLLRDGDEEIRCSVAGALKSLRDPA
ncbi:MAG: HEAT repeat domain-containing protein, partial [Gaiellaceae bacterium]